MTVLLTQIDTQRLWDPLILTPLSLLGLLLIAIGVWGLGVLHRRFQSRELRDLHDRTRLMELELRDLNEAQAAGQKALARLRSDAESSPVAELWWDATEHCIFANPAARTLLKLDPLPTQAELARALGLEGFPSAEKTTLVLSEHLSSASHAKVAGVPPEGVRCLRDPLVAGEGVVWRWRLYVQEPPRLCAALDAMSRADTDSTFIRIQPDGTMSGWTPCLVRWTGYSAEEMAGCSLSLLWDPEGSDDSILDRLLFLATTNGHAERTVRSFHKNGKRLWLRVAVFSLVSEQGFITMIRDCSEHRWLEEQLELRDRAISCAADGIVIADANITDRPIIFVNAAFEKITGYVASDVIGTNLRILHRGDDTQPSLDTLRRSLREGESCRIILRNYRKDGRLFFNELQLDPLRDDDRQITHWVAIVSDITRRIEAEEGMRRLAVELEGRVAQRTAELSRANRELAASSGLKDEFLANVSHELRTPLNAILGLAEALGDGTFGELDPRQIKALTTLRNSGRHLLELINDLLDLSKIESGHMNLQLAPVPLRGLCENCIALLAGEARGKGVRLDLRSSSAPDSIVGDERRLQQILLNLVGNAVKFTPPGGCVELLCTVEPDREAVVLSVKDTGIGIPVQQLAKLFQPFVQVESSLDRRYAGTGLGLALVRRLVAMHGGSVSMESSLGIGTELRVMLPFRLPTPAEEDAERTRLQDKWAVSNAAEGASFLILIEEKLVGITCASGYLSALGYSVAVAEHAEEAGRLAGEHPPDLILLATNTSADLMVKIIGHLRGQLALSQTPIAVLASLVLPGDREKLLEAGAVAYITQPLSLKSLAHLVETYKIGRMSA
jgi:PAS domain S-box-containing protein